MDKIVSLCKRRGFVFQSSEIYGGLASTWDYGPLGAELKRNLKDAWWRSNVYERDDIEGLDASILMHPMTWMASGHVAGFEDTLADCKGCKKRFKVENLVKNKCPECGGDVTEPRQFNLMLKTHLGAVLDEAGLIYMRPETAQGIFVNFQNVVNTSRKKIPFGIAQIGKSFRNEVTTGNFTFRSREFEQMEIEFFVKPGTDETWYEKWVNERFSWYTSLGINKDNLRKRQHEKSELAHYAKACTDIEYKFPFGWSELEGIANRTDFDLKQHMNLSGKDLQYFDEETKERYIPYVIEPSGGIDRSILAFLADAYREEKVKDEKRVVLGLHKKLAPIKAAILPLLKNRGEVVSMAKSLAADLRKSLRVMYDDTASIGRLYRRQDEVGTPYCITIDVESLTDKKVTVRDRDTMKQDRVALDKVKEYLKVQFNM
ncbi:MAG: glycine--tRNA ligase [Candidatus Omnitrophica bacterium]|nr:glycine--tRNA ligase [Candidatus Omnitrophota bacterium]MBU4488743.1 glycine--tRNA ligase [Candidatus Omnitrophota bacterium]MCG2705840.1 glycine--tRNA ligase [Candidatus Omnitrophota bacterium]